MEEIIKGIVEIVKQNKEAGLVLVLCAFVVWIIGRLLMKEMKWRDEWIGKLHVALLENKRAMEDLKTTTDEMQNTLAEVDTDTHDMMLKMETDREVDARVAAELERRSHHGRPNR